MNRLTIFLLAAVTVLLSGVAGRRSFNDAVATSQSVANPQAVRAGAPAKIPTPVAAHLTAPTDAGAVSKQAVTAAKIRPTPASAKPFINGETPDDYVFVKPAQPETRRASALRVAPRAAPPTTSVKPVVSPARRPTAASVPHYERVIADAETLSVADPNRAARRLELITADHPARPEAYEKLAAIRLQLGDFYQAYEMYASAIRKGGKASFSVMHDHTRGSFDSESDDACAGTLSILPDKLTFEGTGHGFAVAWAELLEAGSNRFVGSRIGGFHVKVGADKQSRNFNLAPRSKDKREANIILDLLIDNAEGK
jgi:hypothetical protein